MNWITQEKKKPESQAWSDLISIYEKDIKNCFLDKDGVKNELKQKENEFKNKLSAQNKLIRDLDDRSHDLLESWKKFAKRCNPKVDKRFLQDVKELERFEIGSAERIKFVIQQLASWTSEIATDSKSHANINPMVSNVESASKVLGILYKTEN